MTKKQTSAQLRAIRESNAPGPERPIHEGISFVRRGAVDGGVKCPTCRQECRESKRPFRDVMARLLVALYPYGDRYVHIKDILLTEDSIGGDNVKAAHWGLIEQKYRKDGCVHAGYWRLTQKGRDFVEGKILIPDSYYSFNNIVSRFSAEFISFSDGLKTPIDLEAILGDTVTNDLKNGVAFLIDGDSDVHVSSQASRDF